MIFPLFVQLLPTKFHGPCSKRKIKFIYTLNVSLLISTILSLLYISNNY
ncbi:unnamed protein product [Leptidea sinapis]|uniref:Uncharacterized protein n=1 Tax=Leptidea sinapis TaxID=189913 RepID=A0A5E4PMG1_9NEOP|nr:unnamed protein product [Leptidea sinapis]